MSTLFLSYSFVVFFCFLLVFCLRGYSKQDYLQNKCLNRVRILSILILYGLAAFSGIIFSFEHLVSDIGIALRISALIIFFVSVFFLWSLESPKHKN